MFDCLLTLVPPYSCTVCGFNRDGKIKIRFRRNCPKAPENIAARRKLLETDLAAFHARCVEAGVPVRALPEALEIIERHCTGCDDWLGNGCRLLNGCQQPDKWERAYGLPSGYLPKLIGLSRECGRWTAISAENPG